MNAIKSIHTAHMTNAAHIGYMEQTIKRAKESEKVSENLSSQLSVMEDRYAEEDKYFVMSQKSEKSDEIATAD